MNATTNSCPACGSKKSRATAYGTEIRSSSHNLQIRECCRCKAVYGTCYLGDSYAIVRPFFLKGEAAEQRYFDLTTLGSEGIGRRHGWFDPATRLLTQVG